MKHPIPKSVCMTGAADLAATVAVAVAVAAASASGLGLSACSSTRPRPSFEPFDIATTPPSRDFPDVDAVSLLDRGSLILALDPETHQPVGRLRRYHRLKALRPASDPPPAIVVAPGPSSVIVGLIARTVLPSGETRAVNDSAIRDGLGPDGRPVKTIAVGGLAPGEVLEYTFDEYLRDLRVIEPWPFGGERPVVRSEFAVFVPRGFDVDLRYSENREFIDRPPERFDLEEGTRYFWAENNLVARFPEPGMPLSASLAPRAHVLFLGARHRSATYRGLTSWDDVGEWLNSELPTWETLAATTQGEARRIAGNGSDEDRALRLFEVIARDLGAVHAEERVHLHRARLRHPDDVLRSGRADPINQGLALTAVLRSAGIPAFRGLVSRREGDALQPDIAAVASVDGIVAVVATARGLLIMDPSQLTVDARVPSPALQGTRIVVLRDDGAEMERVPISKAKDSRCESQYLLELGPEGDISGSLEALCTGAEAGALRAALRVAKPEEYPSIVSALLAARGANLPLESVTISELDALSRPIGLRGQVRRRLQSPAPEGFFEFLVGDIIGSSPMDLRPRRRTPLLLSAPHETEVRAILRIPHRHTVTDLPDPIHETWAGGEASLELKVVGPRRLELRRSSNQRMIEVPVEAWPAYRAFAEQIRAAEAHRITVLSE